MCVMLSRENYYTYFSLPSSKKFSLFNTLYCQNVRFCAIIRNFFHFISLLRENIFLDKSFFWVQDKDNPE